MPLFVTRNADVQAFQLEKPLNIETTGGPVRGAPGEYLITLPGGRLAVLGDNLFREIFQAKARNENGLKRNGKRKKSEPKPAEPTSCFADAVRTSLLEGPGTTAEIEERLRESGVALKPNHVSSVCSQRAKAGEFGRDKDGRWFLAERR
jgi:hypothetical protein